MKKKDISEDETEKICLLCEKNIKDHTNEASIELFGGIIKITVHNLCMLDEGKWRNKIEGTARDIAKQALQEILKKI